MGAGTVIVGTGQAGFQTAASLRMEGYEERIMLIGEEEHVPYQRPPLSKGFPLGKQDLESIELRPGKFYQEHAIQLVMGERVSAIDLGAQQVTLDSGGRIAYEKLVLAVGARNRKLAIPGAELDGVLYLRSRNEAVMVKARLEKAQEIVVIGGGFIGLEIAAVARSLGKNVTVLEALSRLMPRAVAPIISDYYRELHTKKGVKIVCGATVREIGGRWGKARKVLLKEGTSFGADLVIVGVGVVPNVELAKEAGLGVANGIVVNEFLETSVENIFATGDCAEFPCVFGGARMRLESVQNAADQAQCVATTVAGRRNPYRALPWFWTDQYDVKLQMAGISQGHDRSVTRGNLEEQKFSVFYFKDGKFVAVDSINRPLDHMMGRKLIARGAALTPEQAADESVDLRTV